MKNNSLGQQLKSNFSNKGDLGAWHAHQTAGVSTKYTDIKQSNGELAPSQLQTDIRNLEGADGQSVNFKKNSFDKKTMEKANQNLQELTALNVQRNDELNAGLLAFLEQQLKTTSNPSLPKRVKLFKQYIQSSNFIHEVYNDCIINSQATYTDIHKKNIAFKEIINGLKSLLLLNNSNSDDFNILFEQLRGKFPALSLSGIFKIDKTTGKYSANIEKIKQFLDCYDLYANYHTSKEYDAYHQHLQTYIDRYINTYEAQTIIRKYNDESATLLNDILKSPKYKTMHEITRELQNGLLFSGVELEHISPRKKNGLNLMFDYTLGLPAKGIQAILQLTYKDKYNEFIHVSDIDKASRMRESYQESSIKSWQYQHATHKYKLHTQAHFEILLDKLFAELAESPTTPQQKADLLKEKQQSRLERELNITIQELDVYFSQSKSIDSYIQEQEKTPTKTDFEKTQREIEYKSLKKKNFALIQACTNKLLTSIDKVGQEQIFSFASNLSNIQQGLQTLKNKKFDLSKYNTDIQTFSALKLLLETILQNAKKSGQPVRLLKSIQVTQSSLNDNDISTIQKIGVASEAEKKANLKYYIEELYKTNNSKNFKQALSTTIKTLKGQLSEQYNTLGKKAIQYGIDSSLTSGEISQAQAKSQTKDLNALTHTRNLRELQKGVHNQHVLFDTKLTESKAKIEQGLQTESDSKLATIPLDLVKYSVNGGANLIYGLLKTGIFTEDIILNLVAKLPDAGLYLENGSINLARATKYASIEAYRHGFGLSNISQQMANGVNFFNAFGFNDVIGIYALANFFAENKTKHDAKILDGSLNGHVYKVKQREKRTNDVADELVSIINLTNATKTASSKLAVTSNNNIEVYLTRDKLKQDLRHLWQTTNMPESMQQNIMIDPMYEGTAARAIANTVRRMNVFGKTLPLGSTSQEKQLEAQNFLSLFYGGEYLKENGEISTPDPQILMASLSVLMNENPLAKILGNSITAAFLPLKVASNFLGGYLAAQTGNPFFLFLNVPGNPLDDVFVATVSFIMSLPVLAVSYPVIAQFYSNQKQTINDLNQVLYSNSKNINYIANNSAAMVAQVVSLGRILAENNIDLSIIQSKEELDAQISKIRNPAHKLEIKKIISNSSHELISNSLPNDIDSNQIANLSLRQERAFEMQNLKAVSLMVPYAKDLFHTLPEDLQYKIINNRKNPSFVGTSKQVVMENIGDILSSIMEYNGANMVLPATMPTYFALSLLYAVVKSGVDISEFGIRKIMKKDVAFAVTDKFTQSSKQISATLSRKNANRMQKDANKAQRLGLPAGKEVSISTTQADGTTPRKQFTTGGKGDLAK
ncbi:MAG: hypothetical protein RLZZ210_326 [Pseudomonadota bacterium]